MLSPSSGRILLDGDSLYDLEPDQRAALRGEKIGFVFQTFNLVPYLSALENVQVPLFLSGMSEAEQKARAANLLERFGLGDRLEHKPSELSVGQQQRVALARVLANDPSVILADEPTGSLDPETSSQVIAFLEELNQEGRTVVMVTHDPEVAQRANQNAGAGSRCYHVPSKCSPTWFGSLNLANSIVLSRCKASFSQKRGVYDEEKGKREKRILVADPRVHDQDRWLLRFGRDLRWNRR